MLQARPVIFGDLSRSRIADNACWIANDYCARRHIPGDDGACADHAAFAHDDTRQQSGVGADRSSLLNERIDEGGWRSFRMRKAIIGKGRIWTYKDIVLKSDAVPKLDATFESHAVANGNLAFDKDVVANIAVTTNARAGKDVGERPNLCSPAYIGTLA